MRATKRDTKKRKSNKYNGGRMNFLMQSMNACDREQSRVSAFLYTYNRNRNRNEQSTKQAGRQGRNMFVGKHIEIRVVSVEPKQMEQGGIGINGDAGGNESEKIRATAAWASPSCRRGCL